MSRMSDDLLSPRCKCFNESGQSAAVRQPNWLFCNSCGWVTECTRCHSVGERPMDVDELTHCSGLSQLLTPVCTFAAPSPSPVADQCRTLSKKRLCTLMNSRETDTTPLGKHNIDASL